MLIFEILKHKSVFPIFCSINNKAADTGICEAATTLQPIIRNVTNYVPDHGSFRGSFITYEALIRRGLSVLLQFNFPYFR